MAADGLCLADRRLVGWPCCEARSIVSKTKTFTWRHSVRATRISSLRQSPTMRLRSLVAGRADRVTPEDVAKQRLE